MLNVGDQFIAYDTTIGDATVFWVDTLNFRLSGNCKKGDVVELKSYALESHRVTLMVEKVEKPYPKDTPEVVDIIVPLSAVGLDTEIVLEEHPDIIHHLTDVKNDNRVFLILLCIPYNRRRKIRIPLGDTGNILEYTYEGL